MSTPLGSFLDWYTPLFESRLRNFIRGRSRDAEKKSPAARRGVRELARYLSGGKHLRGALVQIGYECAGGRRVFLPASLAYELIHGFLLVHDDIMDRSDTRRGRPTLHRRYTGILRRHHAYEAAVHLGNAAALTLGDLAFFWAIHLLLETRTPPGQLRAALRELASTLAETAEGQLTDVLSKWTPGMPPTIPLSLYQQKTARYSVIGPLVVGSILAGGPPALHRAVEAYGLPVGTAYQLRDDLLGLYGDERTIGKSVLSDLREGKPTWLITTAYRKAPAASRRQLRARWGNPAATRADLAVVREVVERSGTRSAAEQLLRQLVGKGMKAILRITRRRELSEILTSFAEFAITRKH